MLTATAWAAQTQASQSPWLVLGKGPSFRKYATASTERFRILALNHVARETRCDAVAMMDYDVFQACADAMLENAGFVLMPWRPHVNFAPGERTLADLLDYDEKLAEVERRGRLVVFNAQTAREGAPYPDEPITPIKFFSAEAAINILAAHGVQEIRTLGVDGGGAYASRFEDLAKVTRLANGQPDFNRQFERFADTLRRHPKLLLGPLDVQTPVRVFVGSDPSQRLAAKVLEHSIRRHASLSVRVECIDNAGLPEPRDPQRRARTGFSFCRFKIPELCGRRGRAIYVDADMQVFTDIRDLWTRSFDDAWLLYSEAPAATGRTPQYSVMLLANLDWDARALIEGLDRGDYDYRQLMSDFAMMPPSRRRPGLEFEWNSLEHYEPGRTKLLHYTDMPTQPWVSRANKNAEVWYAELRQAVADGAIGLSDLDRHIESGFVSPRLPEWAGLPPHPRAAELGATWTPPYRRLVAGASPAAV